jgi:hypothetical protein
MFRSFLACCSLTLVLAVSQVAFAQEIPKEAQSFLSRLAGEWKMETSVDGQTMVGKLKSERTANNEGAIWNWAGTNPQTGEKGTAVGIMGWDGHRKMIVEHMVASDGGTFSSAWSGGPDRWTCKGTGTRFVDGKYEQVKRERVCEWESDDRFIIVFKASSGQEQQAQKTVFTRQ